MDLTTLIGIVLGLVLTVAGIGMDKSLHCLSGQT